MEPIAIIGIACRFPGAANRQEFWEALCQGRDAITDVPIDRWDTEAFHTDEPSVPGKTAVRWGGFLRGVDQFDPYFFGISPREASQMDPQQRVLLEVAWEALEDAGQVVDELAGSRAGVFVGISSFDYGGMQMSDPSRIVDGYMNTGGALSIAANRISYLFDFKGPSLAIDTACASSLAAAHVACRSLWSGESSIALAGGVNMILSPAVTIAFEKLQALSPDGRCKAFDAGADGYVRGEGAGMVVLKPLARAVADGDRIHAVVRGTAMNHNGRSNGLTAPNGLSQQAVIREALAQAGVEPAQIRYVEAHGTGTPLGDPIEMTALGQVLAEGRAPGDRCVVGSVKTNVGHLEAAAGVAGLIKVALALEHREIPPSLHFENPNPYIPFDELPLVVPTTLTPWPEGNGPSFAGLSSFGFGGSNVHFVLEEPPRSPDADPDRQEDPASRALLLPLSARTEEAVRSAAESFRRHLESGEPQAIEDVCYTAGCRRSHHDHRLAVVAASRAEAIDKLDGFLVDEPGPGTSSGRAIPGRRRRVAFVFSGQGSQWLGMGRKLLETEAVFEASLREFDAGVREHGDWSLLEELLADSSSSRLEQVDVIQPAICGMQMALAALWRSWGIEPDAVAGHSMGEVAAAQVAGALSIREAARLICSRGSVVKLASGHGAMAVVELSLDAARREVERFDGRLWVAGSNSPTSTLLSGDPAAMDEILEELQRRDLFCRLIKVDYASHGRHVEPLCEELRRSLRALRSGPVELPFYSSVIGGNAEALPLDVDYWVRNLSEPVLFADVVERLLDDGHDLMLEVSPHPVLVPAIQQGIRHWGRDAQVLASVRRDEDERAVMLGSLGALYTAGCPVSWGALYPDGGRLVALPHYPWQRERFWLDDDGPVDTARSVSAVPGRSDDPDAHPLLGPVVRPAAQPGSLLWQTELNVRGLTYLGDHRVQGSIVLPAAARVEMVLAAAAETLGPGPCVLEAVDWAKPMVLPEEGGRPIQLGFAPGMPGRFSFRLFGLPADDAVGEEPIDLSSGTVRRGDEADRPSDDAVSFVSARDRCTDLLPPERHYEAVAARGLDYGPAFRGIVEIRRREGEAFARLELAESLRPDADRYRIHPVLLDACFQLLALTLPDTILFDGTDSFLPVGLDRLWFGDSRQPSGSLWARAVLDGDAAGEGELIRGDVTLCDDSGQPLLVVRALTAKRLRQQTTPREVEELFYSVRWQPVERASAAPSVDGSWIVFADEQGTGRELGSLLEQRGGRPVLVERGEAFAEIAPGRFRIDPTDADDYRRLIHTVYGDGGKGCRGVVHLWSLDSASGDATTNVALDEAYRLGCGSVLKLAQAMLGVECETPPRLCLVTRGSQPVETSDDPNVAQASLWGLGGTIAIEHPELACALVDLDADPSPREAEALIAEVTSSDPGASRVAIRGGRRCTPTLLRGATSSESSPTRDVVEARTHEDEHFQLDIREPGILDHLTLRSAPPQPPGPGEVQIRVRAAGLNFRDVLLAMGLLPVPDDGRVRLGIECVGTIAELGDGVVGLRVGDEVLAIAQSSFGSTVNTLAACVVPSPEGLDVEQAATILVPFLTAHYCLVGMGRLRPGERVLIHSASGGVGLAAIQVAQRIGAQVIATAGSEEKRDFVRKCGVELVADSRSPTFVDDVTKWTDGEGVDVVLNSIAGEAVGWGLSLLRSGGRFLELGKMDVLQGNSLRFDALVKNVTFSFVDLDRLAHERPAVIGAALRDAMRFFEEEGLEPLPHETFPVTRAVDAFHTMAAARHIGRIVLSMPDRVPVMSDSLFRADETYLLTGGLGGLGLTVARWMVERGARNLALLGRSEPSDEAREHLETMAAAGACVHVARADVASKEQLAGALADVKSRMPPLRGIVHCAGLLDDGIVLQLSDERFQSVMAPKIAGGWNLHSLTVEEPLDFFVLFSSASSVLGSPGQANYAASNAFLDALAHHRRARGLPALSINWGPWSDTGLAARPDRGGRLAAQAMGSITPQQGVVALGLLLEDDAAQVSVMNVSRGRWRDLHAAIGQAPMLADLAREEEASTPAERDDSGNTLRASILAAPPAERRPLLETLIREQVARVLRIPAARLDVDKRLDRMGIDSLMAVELKNRIEDRCRVTLPLMQLVQGPTVASLTDRLLERMTAESVGRPEAEEAPPTSANDRTGSLLLSLLSMKDQGEEPDGS